MASDDQDNDAQSKASGKPKAEADQAFLSDRLHGTKLEIPYAGAMSFGRRRYSRDLEGVDIAILGVPADLTVSNRPGARFGPRGIRAASSQLATGEQWPWGFDPFDRVAVVDMGDVEFEPGYVESLVEATEAFANWILDHDVSMVGLGGDHLISYPLLRAHARKHGPLALIHFDSHSDTWTELGELNHGNMFHQALVEELIDVERSVHVGIRTHNQEHHGIDIIDAFWLEENGVDATVERIGERVGDQKAYLTFDIDCLDPCFAPGTGTPVSGGPSTTWARRVLYGLKGIDFVGMDMVEVAPAYDVAEITSLAAATLVFDYLCLISEGLPHVSQFGEATT